jgi:hypothetical protein
MAKFYNPRDYHTVGFREGRYVPKTKEEIHAEYVNGYGKKKNKPRNEHFNKDWDTDLWD